jgi:protein-disulfide isomerase
MAKLELSPHAIVVAAALAVLGAHCGCRQTVPPPQETDRLLRIENRLAQLEEAARDLSFESGRALARIEETVQKIHKDVESLAGVVARLGSATQPRAAPTPKILDVAVGDAPSQGPPDAPVTIVEFSDFECPYCAGAVQTLQRIASEYGDKVRRVFKHNPMPFHRNAVVAHRAALAAAEEGRFWEMYRLLFANQTQFDRETIRGHAASLGLDLELFDAFMSSDAGVAAIQADREQARSLGLYGSPSFFINGRLLPGEQPYEAFKALIDAELSRK